MRIYFAVLVAALQCLLISADRDGAHCVPTVYRYPPSCLDHPFFNETNATYTRCTYVAEWIWPQSEDFLYIKLQMSLLEREETFNKTLGNPWIGIGFTRGSKMYQKIDATFIHAGETNATFKSFEMNWYDYPEPGSMRDLQALGQYQHLEVADGFVKARFKKRAAKDLLPYDFDFGVNSSVNVVFPILGGDVLDGHFQKHYLTPLVETFDIQQCPPQRENIVEHGHWTLWEEWSSCSASCDKGVIRRTRDCVGPKNDGSDCPGETREIVPCFLERCSATQVDCQEKVDSVEGNAKNTFSFPDDCSLINASKATCDYHASWRWNSGQEFAKFVVYSRATIKWAGIGFSNTMGKEGNIDAVIGYADAKGVLHLKNVWFDSSHRAPKQNVSTSLRPIEGKTEISRLTKNTNSTEGEAGNEDSQTGSDGSKDIFLVLTFLKPVFGKHPFDLNIGIHGGLFWMFPVSGGALTNASIPLGGHAAETVVQKRIELKPCVTKVSTRPKIQCYHCKNKACLFRVPGDILRCPSDVETCRKFDGRMSGRRHIIRECGDPKSNETFAPQAEGEPCPEGDFQFNGRLIHGLMCHCSHSLCNKAAT